MAEIWLIGDKEVDLEVTISERAMFENITEGEHDRRYLCFAAYTPAKESLEKLCIAAVEWVPESDHLTGKKIVLDFCMGVPRLVAITIEEMFIDSVNVEWLTNVYREDAIVNAIDMLLGVKHNYVSSEWRENSLYEWKI